VHPEVNRNLLSGKTIKLGRISQLWVFMMGDVFIRTDGVSVELLPDSHCNWCSKPISPDYFFGTGLCADCYTESNKPPIRIHAVGIYRLHTADNQISQVTTQLYDSLIGQTEGMKGIPANAS